MVITFRKRLLLGSYSIAYLIYQLFLQLPLFVFNIWMYSKVITVVENNSSLSQIVTILIFASFFTLISDLYCSLFEFLLGPWIEEKLGELAGIETLEISRKIAWYEIENGSLRSEFLFLSKNRAKFSLELIQQLGSLASSIMVAVFTGGMLLQASGKYLVLMLVALGFLFLGNYRGGRLLQEKQMACIFPIQKTTYFMGLFSNLRALRDIRINKQEKLLTTYIQKCITDLSHLQTKRSRKIFVNTLIFDGILSDLLLKFMAPLLLVVDLFYFQSISLAEFVSSYNAFNSVFLTLSLLLGKGTQNLISGIRSFRRGKTFFEETKLRVFPRSLGACPDEPSLCSFDNFSFKYPGESEYSLQNISFALSPDEKVLIVGKNGSGKSTLLKVIMQAYPIDTDKDLGSVRFGRHYDSSKIGYHAQGTKLYPIPISENIAQSTNYNPTKIVKALGTVGLMKLVPYVGLPIGASLYENGVELSGGQAQRLALAKNIMASEKNLFLLDEPLSQSDEEMRGVYKEILKENFSGKALVMVSHSNECAELFDRVIVMAQGRIIDQGTHVSLLQRSQNYVELVGID